MIMGLTLLPFREKFARNNNAIRRIYDRAVNKIFEFVHIEKNYVLWYNVKKQYTPSDDVFNS